jgi:polyisoprenoid-binding protein YceI
VTRPHRHPIDRIARALGLAAIVLVAGADVGAQSMQRAPDITPDMPAPMAAEPGGTLVKGARYVIDPTHTFVTYEIGHYATTTNRGRFSTKDGSVQIDGNGRNGTVDITIDMSSINTGVDLLNRHIQSTDFLNVADFPTARFVADRISVAEERVREVQGSLTLLGQSRPIRLQARRFNCYLSPLLKRQVCGGDFEATIERSQWGITWGIPFGFEDKVRLLVQVEAVHIP